MSCQVNVTSMFNDVDEMLSGADAPPGESQAGSILTSALGGPPVDQPPRPAALFSTYLVSPAYYTETDDFLLVKLVTAKGEPFYLLDSNKAAKSLVCSLTRVFLSPYDADTACVDECEGQPALHLVPDCIARQLFSASLKGLCTAKWFAGLVFVSSVGLQFYYRGGDCSAGEPPMIRSVYRVATDSEGHIEAREIRGAITCDYPVPYLMVDESLFAEGAHNIAIIESLTQANVALIDTLCRLEYASLHSGEAFPDELDSTLGGFMGTHSHLVRAQLDAQLRGAGTMSGQTACDDAFVRRQRKSEIDNLVRLMMREVELIGDLKRTLEELQYVQKAVNQCPQAPKLVVCKSQDMSTGAPKTAVATASCSPDDDEEDESGDILLRPLLKLRKESRSSEEKETGDPLLRPLLKLSKQDMEPGARAAIGDESDISSLNEMLGSPMSECSDERIANADLIRSPSSGSDCSR